MIPTLPERRIRHGFACSVRQPAPLGAVRTVALGLVCLLGLSACGSDSGEASGENVAYASDVREFRAARDRDFGRPGSPLPAERRASFAGLRYYPPDPAYRVTARFYPEGREDTITLATSTGEPRSMRRVGHLRFPVPAGGPTEAAGGTGPDSLRLDLFRPVGENDREWFLPFADQTNGTTTYGAGRYIDVDGPEESGRPGDQNLLTLDFNYAYNPYCAYNPDYSCPLVPPSNHLDVPIRAGERYEVEDE